MRKGGKRFELACYRNKIVEWRKKVETNLDEVLQIDTIFTNTSRGEVAKDADLKKAFKTDDKSKIILDMLAKGEVQISKEERQSQQSASHSEIAKMVVERCINPESKKPYTIAQIEREMNAIHFSVKPEMSSKRQALMVIAELKKTIPIERASLRIKIVLPKQQAKSIKQNISTLLTVENEEWVGDLELVCKIEPGNFRGVKQKVDEGSRGKGIVEVIETIDVTDATDETLE